ncbi:MAG: branched-chain amino acid ABC transporter permease, partial [Actinobacteria bacterium]
ERQALWIWGLTVLAVIALTLLYRRTRLGMAMSACAVDRQAARLAGIDVRRVVTISFAFAATLGALAGAAVTPLTQTGFDVGARMGLKGFAAAILGGLGNPVAAVAGGIALGLIESIAIGFISPTYKDAIALLVLLLVLFLRPQGLLGGRRREKV